jgi:PDZ domain-containing protein
MHDLNSCIENSKDTINLTINRYNKEKRLNVKLYDYRGKKIIGISILNMYDISSKYDIKIKSSSSESGSSGGFMTALAIYTELTNLKLPKNVKIAGTGTIEDDEKIGPIDAIKYKLLGAEKQKVNIYFTPEENYIEALKVKKKYKLKLKLVKVSKVDDAISYLNTLR